MRSAIPWFALLSGMIVFSLATGCTKETKTAEVKVVHQELILRQDSPNSFVLDAKGIVRNVGEVDVKDITITGYCRSCQEMFVNGKWFISEYEKTPEQKGFVRYLTPGGEKEFQFEGIAFYFTQSGEKPAALPDNVEIVIESFEVIE